MVSQEGMYVLPVLLWRTTNLIPITICNHLLYDISKIFACFEATHFHNNFPQFRFLMNVDENKCWCTWIMIPKLNWQQILETFLSQIFILFWYEKLCSTIFHGGGTDQNHKPDLFFYKHGKKNVKKNRPI